MGEGLFTFLPLSEEVGNIDKMEGWGGGGGGVVLITILKGIRAV